MLLLIYVNVATLTEKVSNLEKCYIPSPSQSGQREPKKVHVDEAVKTAELRIEREKAR